MNKFFLIPLSIITLLSITTLLGYVSNRAYYSADSSKNSSLQETGGYLLGIVEFDDQGQFHDRQQLETLLDKLKAEERNLVIITFVHGWHHNAEETDRNLRNFKELLSKISLQEQKNHKNRKIVGVYLGWRGESISISYLNLLTFWGRKSTAETVGIQGGVTETLLELEKIVRRLKPKSRNEQKDGEVPSRLIIVGHSFGGLIVYSALAPILLERAVAGDSIIGGVGDLVVLINPAFEALHFANLRESFNSRKEDKNKEQLPLMVVLTSENDDATKIAFPIGRFISTIMMDSHRNDQSKANRTALGHYKPFENSTLISKSPCKNSPLDNSQESDNSQECKVFRESDCCIIQCSEVELRWERSEPYLVTKVDKSIIPDHSKIWDEDSKILPVLRSLILKYTGESKLLVASCSNSNTDESDPPSLPDTKDQKEPFVIPTSYDEKMIETEKWELTGFRWLLNNDWEGAKRAFENAHAIWPTYHNIKGIVGLFEQDDGNRDSRALYEKITQKYPFVIPTSYNGKMIETEKWELRGFRWLLNNDWKGAKWAFENAYRIWPTYHNVEEILDLLKQHDKTQDYRALYEKIIQEYSWGMSEKLKEEFKEKLKDHSK